LATDVLTIKAAAKIISKHLVLRTS
jgi:hypothetical protein